MKQRRSSSLWDTSAPAITPELPPTKAAHDALIRENKKLKHLLNAERRRYNRTHAILVEHIEQLQTKADALKEAVFLNLGSAVRVSQGGTK